MPESRLAAQLDFILEVGKLKHVLRRSYLPHGSRRENDAEHSWHLALMAVVLAEHAAEPVDPARVVLMLLVHDLVEIDAGDTFMYDAEAQADKASREERAADRIFALLPPDQARRWRALWDEFEARRSPDARFAAAIDRLQPQLLNYHTQGRLWREHAVTVDQVIARNQHMADGAPALWHYARRLLRDAVARGYLRPAATDSGD
ncbi:MAG: HD domain-containing protein [Candidatus Brocadiia bacterium]